MERQPINSSTIKSAGWEESTETLEIEFSSGGVYRYSAVPQKTWDAFLAATSKGSFFMAIIRGQFEYVCLNPKKKEEKEHGQPEAKEDSKSEAKRKAAQTKPAKT